MPVIYTDKYNNSDIAIWKVDESIDELIALSGISPSFYNQFNNLKRKKEVAAVRALLHYMLGAVCEINYTSAGAPFLKENLPNISISHTLGYVAIIIGNNNRVSLDIEKKSDTVLKVKHKFMSNRELDLITSDETLYRDYLTVCWSAKETLFKILKKEEIDFREHLVIKKINHFVNNDFIIMEENKTNEKEEFIIRYQITKDFILTYCCK